MVGNYKSYFRNVKRKGKVIFDHSTTLNIVPNLSQLIAEEENKFKPS